MRNRWPAAADERAWLNLSGSSSAEPGVLVVEFSPYDRRTGSALELRVECTPVGLVAVWLTEEGRFVKVQAVGEA